MSTCGGWHFSLARLLAAIVILAAALAMLVGATPLWADVCSALFIFIMLVAVVAVPYRRGPARAFWLGFAVLGWGYLFYGRFIASPTPADNALEQLHHLVRRFEPPDLPSTTSVQITARGTLRFNGREVGADEVVETFSAHLRRSGHQYVALYVEPGYPDQELVNSVYRSVNSVLRNAPNVSRRKDTNQALGYVPAQQEFHRVGHQLCNLLFALLGGLAGRLLYATSDRPEATAH